MEMPSTSLYRPLLPQLREFNGINPNSLVIMDNCSIHNVQKVIDLIQSVGALVIFTFNAN